MSTPLILDVPPATRRVGVAVSAGPLAVLDTPAIGTPRGATVVLVPGYTGSKEDFLAILEPLAAGRRRVVTYDQRGQYESLGPNDDTAYTVQALGNELLELIDALGDGPVHVVGHSFGGLVARGAALTRPAAFRSVTLLDSGPAAIGGQRAETIHSLRPVLEQHGMEAVWDRTVEMSLAAGAVPVSGDVATFLHRRFMASSEAGLRAMGDALLSEPDRSEELAALGLPLLVAYGEYDDAWPPAEQAAMALRLGARRAVIAGAVHSPAVEAAADTVEVLTTFFDHADAG